MNVTELISQPERSSVVRPEPRNEYVISETPERSGASVAFISRFEQPKKAPEKAPHSISPQFSTDKIFSLSPPATKNMPGNVPVMVTVYVPGVA
jgi:hypothetical protein